MSFAERIGLPDAFQTTLLVVALLLALAPYFSGLAIGGVQLPRLDRRRRRMLTVLGPVSLIAMVVLVLPFEALAPPPSRLQIVAADVTETGEIDLAISNTGTVAALLTRIEIEVIADRHKTARPALASSARYQIAIDDFALGRRYALVIRHLVPPKTTERIVVAPQTNRSLRARVRVHSAGGTVMTREVELWPDRR